MAKKSLLLVDADSKSLRMLEVSLRKSGFSVTTAVHAKDARDKLNHAAPDLIITDTKLPGDESGFDFVGKLKAANETANIPIIFLSSENKLEQKVAGLELGVDDYLTKPIYIKEVLTRVRVLLDKREKQTLERRERSSSFSGLLGDMGLVDLMQTVEIGRKSGRLNIETRSQRGQVSFREGKVCDARSRRLTGERAFYRMLVWNEGTFSMEFGAHDDPDVIELSTQGLLMEGMRRVDEWGRLIEQLPPLEHRFEIDFTELVDRLAEIPDEINALLRLFDGQRTLIEVVDETDFGDLEALEIASKLYFEGLIFDVTDREAAPEAGPGVEAWLQEPEPTTHGHDENENEMLVPNDTTPPMAADGGHVAHATGGSSGAFLAPPSGSASSGATGTPDHRPDDHAVVTAHQDHAEQAGELEASQHDGPPSTPIDQAVDAMFADAIPTIPGRPAPATGAPATAAPTLRLPGDDGDAPRPLPTSIGEEPESRSVVPRASVGARAWSSTHVAPAAADDSEDDWEDIVAPDEEKTPAAATPALTAVAITDPSAGEALAAELGLSEDELALALAADPDTTAATIIDGASRLPADGDLAERISAQLDGDSDVPAELQRDGFDDDPSQVDTDKGRKAPPSPTPMTAAPSTFGAANDDDGDDGDDGDDETSDAGDSLNENTPDDATLPVQPADAIHTRRTQLDLEPLKVERFGVNPGIAAAIFVVGFVVVLLVVRGCGDEQQPTGHLADAGAMTTPPPVEPPPPPPVAPPPPPAPPPATEAETAAAQYAKQLKIADAFAAKGDFSRGVRAYKAALAINSNGVAAHLGLGNAYYELDTLDAAIVHLEKARALAPRDPQVYVLLGTAYQSAGRTADAVTAYQKYLALAPDGKFARDVRGILKGLAP